LGRSPNSTRERLRHRGMLDLNPKPADYPPSNVERLRSSPLLDGRFRFTVNARFYWPRSVFGSDSNVFRYVSVFVARYQRRSEDQHCESSRHQHGQSVTAQMKTEKESLMFVSCVHDVTLSSTTANRDTSRSADESPRQACLGEVATSIDIDNAIMMDSSFHSSPWL
jgi:hypothetical protein